MLQEILANHVPETWTYSSYDDRRYKLVDLQPGDREYREVTAAFQSMAIDRVVRIQNPFIYGRYKIRKEYLALSGSVKESTAYHPVANADVAKVAEYNCDIRRYTARRNAQIDGKNPNFFSTPSDAVATFSAYGSSQAMAIVVVKLLNAGNDWDSQYTPEYVVYMQ